MDDTERHLLARIVQEDGLQALEQAALEVDRLAVEVEHEVGRIDLVAGTVVGQDPVAAVGHVLDARVTLGRLALEGQRNPFRGMSMFFTVVKSKSC